MTDADKNAVPPDLAALRQAAQCAGRMGARATIQARVERLRAECAELEYLLLVLDGLDCFNDPRFDAALWRILMNRAQW